MKTYISIFAKWLIFGFVFQLPISLVFSQSPEKMSYQAVIRNNMGQLVVDKNVGIRIQIKQGSQFGASVFVETHTTATNENGLISLEIGNGTEVLGSFESIDWVNGPYFLYTEIDPAGETNYSVFLISQILSVPYAMHAKTAEIAEGAATKAYVDDLKIQIDELQLLAGINIKDIDENIYNTIKIGNQTWMAENLRTTKYNDSAEIPLVTDKIDWYSLNTPGYCWYNNNNNNDKLSNGALYNWYAVNTGKLCPSGWHVPGDVEWYNLALYLEGIFDPNKGYFYNAGGKLKEKGTVHWLSPNTGATNESGFTAIPAGVRMNTGEFRYIGEYAFWWLPVKNSDPYSWVYSISTFTSNFYPGSDFRKSGLSVRCIKD